MANQISQDAIEGFEKWRKVEQYKFTVERIVPAILIRRVLFEGIVQSHALDLLLAATRKRLNNQHLYFDTGPVTPIHAGEFLTDYVMIGLSDTPAGGIYAETHITQTEIRQMADAGHRAVRYEPTKLLDTPSDPPCNAESGDDFFPPIAADRTTAPTLEDIQESRRPAFELSNHESGIKQEIYLNGRIEGFPPNTSIVNWMSCLFSGMKAREVMRRR